MQRFFSLAPDSFEEYEAIDLEDLADVLLTEGLHRFAHDVAKWLITFCEGTALEMFARLMIGVLIGCSQVDFFSMSCESV